MRKPVFSFIVGVAVGIILAFSFVRIVAFMEGADMRMYRGFNRVRLDMPREEVVKLMGSEGRQADTFRIGQREGFEIEYRTASRVGAAYFVSWVTGIDMVFTVAFDEHDKAIYKARGGT
jgi:hypothetical protein